MSGNTKIYPIISVATKGAEEMMRLTLLNKTLDINITNEAGVNAFWMACMYGHGQIMSMLAEAGINVMNCNKNKVNALHLAVKRNHVNIVEMLLDSGYPLDHETSEGMTALMLASYNGWG